VLQSRVRLALYYGSGAQCAALMPGLRQWRRGVTCSVADHRWRAGVRPCASHSSCARLSG